MNGGMTLTHEEKIDIDEHLTKKKLPLNIAVTFDDVWIPEGFSKTRSRQEIWSHPELSFKTEVGNGVFLHYPIFSANMASVTGLEMALAMLRSGGGYFLPQMWHIDKRLEILEQIRLSDAPFNKNPLVTTPEKTLEVALSEPQKFGISGLLVVNNLHEKRLVGNLSKRDYYFGYSENKNLPVGTLMTRGVITVDPTATLDTVRVLMKKNKIEKIPVVDVERRLLGLYTAHGVFYELRHPRATRDNLEGFVLFGSVRVGKEITKETREEFERQAKLGVKVMLFDTARPYAINLKELLEFSVKEYPHFVNVAGNISTAEGAKALFEWGAHIVKVNQGRGSQCRTSRATGIGQPQITAIAEASVMAKRYGGKIIADGGMKSSGDIAKAFIAGADFVMTGSMLVGTYESPPETELKEDRETGKYYMVKKYEGSASLEVQKKRILEGTLNERRAPEGEWEYYPVTGSARTQIPDLFEWTASSMTYHGATTLDELREYGHFGGRLQTSAGYKEGSKS